MSDQQEPADQQPTKKELSAQFHERYDVIEQELEEAKAEVKEVIESRKNLRKIIKATGINMVGFDRARADRDKPGVVREEENAEYLQQMRWLNKPVGEQAELDLGEPETAPPDIQIERAQNHGRAVGKNGGDRNDCPWTPGTLLFATWIEGWSEGRKEWETAQEASAQGAVPVKRGPGRPRKDAPKPSEMAAGIIHEPGTSGEVEPAPAAPKRKRGAVDLDFDSDTAGRA